MKIVLLVVVSIVTMSIIGTAIFGMSAITSNFDNYVEQPEHSKSVHHIMQDIDDDIIIIKNEISSVHIPENLPIRSQENTQDTKDVDIKDSWYVGEGLKQGDFFSYSLCHLEYHECAELRMDIWIKEDVQIEGKDVWIADTVVYERHMIIKNQMEFAKSDMKNIGNMTELDSYEQAFQSSVLWLSEYATLSDDSDNDEKGPKEFAAESWGKFGNIGGFQVAPLFAESITIPAGTFETVAIGWEGNPFWSKIWVADGFPFPVKGKIYTHITDGIPPPEFDFTLLEYKEDVQHNPFEDIVPIEERTPTEGCNRDFEKEVSIKNFTNSSDYIVHAFYGPENPMYGCEMQWLIKFIDKNDDTEFLTQVQFDFMVADENLHPLRSIAQEEGRQYFYSPSGQYLLDMIVDENPGDAKYVIWIYGLAPEGIIPSTESDHLEIVVPVIPLE